MEEFNHEKMMAFFDKIYELDGFFGQGKGDTDFKDYKEVWQYLTNCGYELRFSNGEPITEENAIDWFLLRK